MNHPSDMPESERASRNEEALTDLKRARAVWTAEYWAGDHADQALCIECEFPAELCSCDEFFQPTVKETP